MIDPEAFRERMKCRWTADLGNVYTPKLGLQWLELARVFGAHIAAHDDPTARERYTVIAAALGAGKTQGTAAYCAMLADRHADEEQPGVLIVTRRIEDANEIVRTINGIARRPDFAIAYHSEVAARVLRLSDLAQYPVVVVTHRGYQLALDQMSREHGGRWPEFARYRQGQRKLNVIDEAIDLVEHDSLTVDGLKKALALIPEALWQANRTQCRLLEETLEHLRSPEAFQIPDGKRAALYAALSRGQAPDVSELIGQLSLTSFKRVRFGRASMAGDEVRDQVLETLRAVDRVYRQWAYVAKLPTGEQTLHTARLILPKETKGAVILDATARANTLYRLFGDRVEVKALPQSRSYRNLHLHVSRGHKTGKGYIVEEAEKAAGEIMANLTRHLRANRKVLLVTHKDAEASFAQYSPAFQMWTAHWGQIDGSNDWRDCDAICIVSLPRRPDSWATSSYFAITGDLRDALLGEEGDSLRREIRNGQVISDVAQAIGRTRCRRVVDVGGNCDPVDVFLFLPDSAEGAEIARGLRDHFKGCRYSEMVYEGTVTKAKPKASKIEEAFLLCLRGLPVGTTTAKELRESAFRACSPASWKRLTAVLKDSTSQLHREMASLGIVFLAGSRGRGAGAAFVRG